MTDDKIIDLGAYSESILTEPRFNQLVTEFESAVAQQFLCTKPDDQKLRQEIFETLNGFRTFLGFMQTLVKEATTILAPAEPTIDGEAPDDEVLDIYRN